MFFFAGGAIEEIAFALLKNAGLVIEYELQLWEFELKVGFELRSGVGLRVVAGGKEIFDLRLAPLFALVVRLEDEFRPLVVVRLKLLEILLHRLIFRTEVLHGIAAGGKSLDLRFLAMGGE